MEEVLSSLGWLIIEILLVGTGRLVVRISTFGHWRGERFGGNESRVNAAAGSLSFVLHGQRVITRNGLLFIGLGFYVIAPIVAFYLLSA